MNQKFSRGMMIAAAAAVLISSGALNAGDESAPDQAKVRCYGINACAGKAECGTKENNNACAGTNTCRGKGWITVTAKACRDQKGQILDVQPTNAPVSAPASAPSAH